MSGPAVQPEPPLAPTASAPWWRGALALLGPFLALVLLWGAFALAGWLRADPEDPLARPWAFIAWKNQCTILAQSAILAIGACGIMMVIVAGGIDLSLGSLIALTGVVTALTMDAGAGPLTACAVVLATGALCGAFNGVLTACTGIAPFIVTLGTMLVFRGAAKGLAGNQSINLAPSWIDGLMRPFPTALDPAWLRPIPVAPGVLIAVVVAVITAAVLRLTVFGRHLYAIGSNPAAARLCGVRVRTTTVAVYALAGLFFGLAGLLEAAKLHQGDPTTAGGRELDVIAAAVIGGASLTGGVGTALGAVIGALTIGVLRNGCQLLEWQPWRQEIIIGVVIIIAVGVDRLRLWRASRR